ncbi:Acg family FMN-binding oxidoreductase [Haloarchaeobius sp. HRN-SO-5]|uniref:Acg family FMN-binding oxidoreductase n=1 Tax=Haloarchaeobius sp. HRN-SO-5 TaxID=3446118 RepID=UPI003EB96A89
MADTRTPPDPTAFPSGDPLAEQAEFLLRYAVLAPSSHNSQPWAFEVADGSIAVYADASRQLDVADPDGRELYLSVGCALENLSVAAERFGLEYTVEYASVDAPEPSSEDGLLHVATVRLDSPASPPGPESALFDAIAERHTNHRPFDDRPVPESLRSRFEHYAKAEGLGLELVTDSMRREEIALLQTRADERQFDDPAYREELAYWIGTGALGANWLTARIGQLAVRHLDVGEREGRTNSKLVTSAPVIAVLTANSDDAVTCLKAGRVFERIALAAESEGLAVHPMSQILEVDELRDDLTTLLELGAETPLHLFRLGYAEPDSTRTPRRPVEEVLL